MSVPQSVTDVFRGEKDCFNGITIDSEVENCEEDTFIKKLEASLEFWLKEKLHAVWFKVALQQADWVPKLVKNGFVFHHSRSTFVSMVKWLPTDEVCSIPHYAHTMIGVGAVVVNSSNEILVVKERFRLSSHWKLPGGYVDPDEDIQDAAVREVLEETNIKTKFRFLICFRHTHHANFDCSDIYFIACLTPLSDVVTKSDHEISECQWMKIDDFMESPEVHETTRSYVRKYLEYEEKGSTIGCKKEMHPSLRKPICFYSIENNHIIKDS